MNILYVTTTTRWKRPYDDPSVRYRCYNMADALCRLGHCAFVCTSENFFKEPEAFKDFDAYVFHRPLYSELYKKMSKAGKLLIADYDDYIIDISTVNQMPRVQSGNADGEFVAGILANNYEGAAEFQYFTASTEPLKEKIVNKMAINPQNCQVIHNALSDTLIGTSRLARLYVEKKFDFGYFPGTATHDIDWSVFNKAASQTDFRRTVSMLVVGPLNIDQINQHVQITRHDYVDFHELPWLMAQCRNIIAPLEVSSFTECKSGLKFWESLLCGCRVLATPISDIDRFDSKSLLKCRTIEDWINNLEKLSKEKFAPVSEEEISSLELQADIMREAGKLIEFLQNVRKLDKIDL